MSTVTPESPSATANQAEIDDNERIALDKAIDVLRAGEQTWAGLSLADRAALLMQVHSRVAAASEEWAMTAARIKRLPADSPLVGEEWISGPYPVLTGLGVLAASLTAMAEGRSPVADARLRTAAGGRVAVPVLPHNPYEALLMHGFHAEVWMQPGISARQVVAEAGLAAKHPERTNGIGLVLGAGNITSIAPLDALYELVANNRVVLLKLNPVMRELEAVYRTAFAPLIDLGVLQTVQGGAAAGAYLTAHPDIAHIHITGSAITHDVIVYGPGEDGRARKAAGTPLLDKPITSELGGVAPVIVVPGQWSKKDLEYQAAHIATMRLHNGGYNCIAGQVVIISADWAQKDDFLAALRAAFDRAPARPAWYPGSDDRLAGALASYPGAARLGEGGCRLLVETEAAEAAALENTEYFSPVLGVVQLHGGGARFLEDAVAHANERLTGTLGANVLVDPRARKAMGDRFDELIADLRYGTVAINAWTGVGFLTAAATWGAFPGHTLEDIQSGRGVVHNALLLEGTERTVVTGPFRPFPRSVMHGEFALFPTPPWFVTARSAALTGRRLAGFAAHPSWGSMPAVFAAAFRA
ncbi:aldehyde dehydrogenase family protein [Microbacterium sp. KUDC0406]|uniref:aldehyde dehydrogenase family protein n=1 Tax=Microbacterium sp. KUDC0406 TaxID=2909588 RepID=UPI001F350A7E|nr:aldehyde dehydrogenase family protein [Microbacterium sp. KUDC0406]UJP10807.1 aldehyde dehydrogenase family protein [Microbacterium sp. KUDC0406]